MGSEQIMFLPPNDILPRIPTNYFPTNNPYSSQASNWISTMQGQAAYLTGVHASDRENLIYLQ